MLWVYDHYKYVYSYSVGIDFNRQNHRFFDDFSVGVSLEAPMDTLLGVQ